VLKVDGIGVASVYIVAARDGLLPLMLGCPTTPGASQIRGKYRPGDDRAGRHCADPLRHRRRGRCGRDQGAHALASRSTSSTPWCSAESNARKGGLAMQRYTGCCGFNRWLRTCASGTATRSVACRPCTCGTYRGRHPCAQRWWCAVLFRPLLSHKHRSVLPPAPARRSILPRGRYPPRGSGRRTPGCCSPGARPRCDQGNVRTPEQP
jgi:hypothetical protein